MAHYARIEDGFVTNIIVVNNNELLVDGIESELKGNIRKQYAGIGYTYNEIADVFVAPQPFPSWSLDANYDWQAPIECPADGNDYEWDEANQVWVELPAI
jgi:hypothetical protein